MKLFPKVRIVDHPTEKYFTLEFKKNRWGPMWFHYRNYHYATEAFEIGHNRTGLKDQILEIVKKNADSLSKQEIVYEV